MLKGMFNTLFSPGDGQFKQMLDINYVNGGPLGDIFRLSFKKYIEKWIFKYPAGYFVFLYSFLFLFIIYFGIILLLLHFKTIDLNFWFFSFCAGTFLYFLFTSGGLETNFRFRSPMIPSLLFLSFKG